MSTRLEKAERAAQAKKIKPAFHRQIVIEERNKQIFALKQRLHEADKETKWLRASLEHAMEMVTPDDECAECREIQERLYGDVER